MEGRPTALDPGRPKRLGGPTIGLDELLAVGVCGALVAALATSGLHDAVPVPPAPPAEVLPAARALRLPLVQTEAQRRVLDPFLIRAQRPAVPPSGASQVVRPTPQVPIAPDGPVWASAEVAGAVLTLEPDPAPGDAYRVWDEDGRWLAGRAPRGARGDGMPDSGGAHRMTLFPTATSTASYAYTRRLIEGGRLPPADAVHPEAFVHAVPVGAPEVPSGRAAQVEAEVVPDPLDPTRHILRLAVAAPSRMGGRDAGRHLVLVVDGSGSMGLDGRLDLVRRGIRSLVQQLGADDSISLVRYGEGATVVLPQGPATWERVSNALDALNADGASVLGDGLDAGWRVAATLPREGQRHLIVWTDGEANGPNAEQERWVRTARGWRTAGVHLSVVRAGSGVQPPPVLERLVVAGGGSQMALTDSQDSDSAAHLAPLFSGPSTLDGMAVSIDWNPRLVDAWRPIGGGRTGSRARPGPLGPGERWTALMELQLSSPPPGARLGTATLRGPAGSGLESMVTAEVRAPRSGASFADASPDLRMTWGAAAFAEALTGARAVPLADLANVLTERHRPDEATDLSLIRTVRRAAELQRRPRHDGRTAGVHEGIVAQGGTLRGCVADARYRHPELVGALSLGLRLYGGRVAGVDVLGNDTGDAELEACFIRTASVWRFEDAADADVVLPFRISTRARAGRGGASG